MPECSRVLTAGRSARVFGHDAVVVCHVAVRLLFGPFVTCALHHFLEWLVIPVALTTVG